MARSGVADPEGVPLYTEVGDPAMVKEGSRVGNAVIEVLGDVLTVAVPQEVLDRVADITGVTLSLPLPLP